VIFLYRPYNEFDSRGPSVRPSVLTLRGALRRLELFGNIFAYGLGTRTVCVKILEKNSEGLLVIVQLK